MLALHPGEMTRRYIAGERARFISPIALYLFTVFAMFAVLNFTGAFNTDPESFKVSLQEKLLRTSGRWSSLRQSERIRRPPRTNWPGSIRRSPTARRNSPARNYYRPGVRVRRNGCGHSGWVRPLIEDNAKPAIAVIENQEAASKYSWLLIPLSVPFLWLLFPLRRRYRLYDHTVFVTYSLSFMMMLVIAGAAGCGGLDGACRLPVLRPSLPHVPAPQGRL